MLINRESLQALFFTLEALFQEAYDSVDPKWQRFATRVVSTSASTDQVWVTQFPMLEKWVGPRVIKSLAGMKYVLENDDYAATIGVKRNDFMDDNLGVYRAAAQGQGKAAAVWPDRLVIAALNASFEAHCFDGRPFIDAAHPLADATDFSNHMTKALKADTLANAMASLGAAITMLQTMTDDNGEPLGLTADLLIVPPALRDTANILSRATHLGDDANPYMGIEVEANPRLTSATKWWVAHTSGPVMPLIFQERMAPQVVSLMSPEDHHVFKWKEYLFGVDSRGAAGYSLPQLIVGSTGTT